MFGKPTLVHNVETVSHVPEIIISNGEDISKYYCLTGDVKTPGLYLERLGIEASMLVENQGTTSNTDVKAFLPGGLSGGILPGSQITLKLDYDSVRKAGAGLGTGAFISLSRERCIVDVSARIEKFFEKESCGKCTPCRLGTKKLSDLLDSISHGTASEKDVEDGVSFANVMVDGSICALGQAAGKLFIDSLTRFRGEFDDHLKGKCPAKVCDLWGST
ncbi:NADH dehydrogenase (quinone) [mine drainage metagenome]|uniref:NADH dehydrogenase (Quinone) n=2 Tax=mine drainage metagenome TaxID=410659 RepID=T0YUT8_9ZZZZ